MIFFCHSFFPRGCQTLNLNSIFCCQNKLFTNEWMNFSFRISTFKVWHPSRRAESHIWGNFFIFEKTSRYQSRFRNELRYHSKLLGRIFSFVFFLEKLKITVVSNVYAPDLKLLNWLCHYLSTLLKLLSFTSDISPALLLLGFGEWILSTMLFY